MGCIIRYKAKSGWKKSGKANPVNLACEARAAPVAGIEAVGDFLDGGTRFLLKTIPLFVHTHNRVLPFSKHLKLETQLKYRHPYIAAGRRFSCRAKQQNQIGKRDNGPHLAQKKLSQRRL